MDSGNVFKVWGTRRRILLTDTIELDLLHLKKNTFCSTHFHKNKLNLFTVIKGRIRIETEYGRIILRKNESFKVSPPLKHRFVALKDSIMVETAYVTKGIIDEDDINRGLLGGRIIKGKYISIPELRKNGQLEIDNE